MLVIAPVISAICAITGIYVSYYLDTASGGMVVMTQGIVFALVYLFSPSQGSLRSGLRSGVGPERNTAPWPSGRS
ncbi:hypothetical protein GCM10020255_038820 [Rhodococcus baikonurensis]